MTHWVLEARKKERRQDKEGGGGQGHSPAISEDRWRAIWLPVCEHCLALELDTAQYRTVACCREEREVLIQAQASRAFFSLPPSLLPRVGCGWVATDLWVLAVLPRLT